jgi:hypothetical protein
VRPPAAPTGAHAWGRPTRPEPRVLPGYACAPRAIGNHLQASERQRLAGLQVAAVRLLRGERLIQRGNIAPLDNPSDNLHHMLLPTIALGLPWAALLTQLVRASLLTGDAVYDRLQALGPLSTALRRALNTAGISVVDVPVLANGRLELHY